MNYKIIRKYYTILTFFFILNIIFVYGIIADVNNNLLSHDPIYINGNNDFSINNGVISGDGTKINPYLIEGWEIQATNQNSGIFIENTDKYFIIQNCKIHYKDGRTAYLRNYLLKKDFFPKGIHLNNVKNGIISNCFINGTGQAFCINNSSDNFIMNCQIYKNFCGIGVKSNSNNNIIKNCNSQNYVCGFCIYYNSKNNIVENCSTALVYSLVLTPFKILINKFLQAGWSGFYIFDSSNNSFINCRCYSTNLLKDSLIKNFYSRTIEGVYIGGNSHHNKLLSILCYNLPVGIKIDGISSFNFINNCKLLNNKYGIFIESKKVVSNDIINNNLIDNRLNAFDKSTTNIWNGNYWDDWLGLKLIIFRKLPYHIPGRFIDNYDLNPRLYPI